MVVGQCKLCGQRAEIIDSHVWPQFAYRMFVSNLPKGGQFIDLHTANPKAWKQYTRPWFCEPCDQNLLGKDEKYAAEFCERVSKARTEVHDYDNRLLRFLVSISWRAAKLWHEQLRRDVDERTKKAYKRWKDYIRGKARDLGPYTQHLFIVFDPKVSMHKGLGGEVFVEDRLVLSQVGHLFIIGLLDRSHLSARDLDVWSHSIVHKDGGTIKPVLEWRVGSEVTPDFARLLRWHEQRIKHLICKLASDNSMKRKKVRRAE